MGGFEALTHMVGGVEKTYFQPINDADGTNGLLDVDANIEQRSHLRNAVEWLYWWSHASGTGLILGNTEIFTANVANTNGTVKPFNAGNVLNMGSDDISICGWGSPSIAGGFFILKHASGPRFMTTIEPAGTVVVELTVQDGVNRRVWVSDVIADLLDGNLHSIIVKTNRTSNSCVIYVDGVLVPNSLRIAIGSVATGNITNTSPLYIGARDTDTAGLFDGRLINMGWAPAGDLTPFVAEFHNGGTPKCWEIMSDEFKAEFASGDFWPLENHAGFLNQELTGQAQGTMMVDLNATGFTGSAQIECEPYPYQLFSANVANLNGSTQYFNLGNPTDLRILGNITMSIWVTLDSIGSTHQPLISRTQDGGAINGEAYRIDVTTSGLFGTLLSSDGGYVNKGEVFEASPLVAGVRYMLTSVYDGATITQYINGVPSASLPYTLGISPQSGAEVYIGSLELGPQYLDGEMHSPLITDRALTQEEITAMYNGGIPPCWDLLVERQPSLADVLYTARLYNHTGDVGNELVNQGVSTITTTNISSTPFTGTAQIECEAYIPPVGIQWTQDFSLLDPVTDVVYGIDPAVTTWIDKGTSLTNLTQTTVANQADLVAGEMVFDGDDNYDGVIPVSGDLSYYFEINVTPDAIVARRLIEKAGTTSAFIILTTGNNENLRLKSLEGNNNDFVNYSWTSGLKKMMITKTGTVGKLFVDGVLVDTINTLSGTIGDFDTLGSTSKPSVAGNAKAFKGIDRALTDAEAIAETT